MAAKLDLQAQSKIVRNRNGYRVERTALVTGVTGNIEALLLNAINDGQLPNYGDVHPEIADIYLHNISAEPQGGGAYVVRLSYYKDPTQAVGSSNATVRSTARTVVEELTTDRDGNPMTTQYVVNSSLYYQQSLIYKTWRAEREIPIVGYQFEYLENSFPKADQDNYLGKVNSVIWNGYAVDTVFCTAFDVIEEGDYFRCVVEFAINPDSWQFTGKVNDSPDSIVSSTDPDLDQTTGTKTFDIYDAVDFTPLGFTI